MAWKKLDRVLPVSAWGKPLLRFRDGRWRVFIVSAPALPTKAHMTAAYAWVRDTNKRK